MISSQDRVQYGLARVALSYLHLLAHDPGDMPHDGNAEVALDLLRRAETLIRPVGQVSQAETAQQSQEDRDRKNRQGTWLDLPAAGRRRNDSCVIAAKVPDDIDLLQPFDDAVVELLATGDLIVERLLTRLVTAPGAWHPRTRP